MNDIFSCPALKAFKVGKAASHLRKAHAILDELEDMNAKTDGDFHGILEYCTWLAMRYRQTANMQMKDLHEDRCKDNN